MEKATKSDHQKAFAQLVDTTVPSALEFKSDPPVLVPLRELMANSTQSREALMSIINDIRRAYRRTLSEDRRHLLEALVNVVQRGSVAKAHRHVHEARQGLAEVRLETRLAPAIDQLPEIAPSRKVLLRGVVGLAPEEHRVRVARGVGVPLDDFAEDDRRAVVVLHAVEDFAVGEALLG